jgi:type IV secretion system protein VirB10
MSEANETQQMQVLPGERGIPTIGELVGGNVAARKRIAAIVVLGALVAVGAVFAWKNGKEVEQVAKKETQSFSSPSPAKTFGDPPTPKRPIFIPTAPTTPTDPASTAPKTPGELLVDDTPKAKSSGGGGSRPRAPSLDKAQSPLMVGGGSSSAAPSDQPPSLDSYLASLQGLSAAAANPTIQDSVAKTSAATVSASLIGDRNFLLAQGSFIDCVLQTRIDSTVPGMTSCVVSRNVFSDNGKILLIERGSTVSGEYQADLQQGQARLFVLWTRLKTPNGVVVQLESPGTDALGGAGVPGRVNTHFFARFGSALLLSLVDDVAGAAVGTLSKGEGQVLNFGNTAGAAQGAAQEVIKSTISIKPTLTKNQGEVVGIYVANDLDFSEVYRATSY